MAVTSSSFFEAHDGSGAPISSAGFAVEGGKSTRVWELDEPNEEDIGAAITLILGGTTYAAQPSGRLNRTLPLADPEFPWLYASSIPSIKGFGRYGKQEADSELEAPSFPFFSFWSNYLFTVESTPRPYPVLPDAGIRRKSSFWYPETGGGTTPQSFTYVEEWNRFCDWDMIPQNDYITQQRGSMQFKTGSGTGANGLSYVAMPRTFMPNAIFKVTWFLVPLRYIISPNSYLRRWRGRVNQFDWTGPGGLQFNSGELLYMAYSQKKYTPPVQKIINLGGGSSVDSTSKLCNIELTFLHTSRVGTDLPADPTNQNYVVGGHNLLPYPGGKASGSPVVPKGFYYAQTNDTDHTPSWLSFPLEILFTDPDAPGGIAP